MPSPKSHVAVTGHVTLVTVGVKYTDSCINAGLETATSGEIEIGGRVVTAVPPKDRDIAMVFQTYALYPSMTVRQNITFGMECRNVPKAQQAEALATLGNLFARHEMWRPALDAYRASLDRHDDEDARKIYEDMREKHGNAEDERDDERENGHS